MRIGSAQYRDRTPYPWNLWAQLFAQMPASYHNAAKSLGLRIEPIEHRDPESGDIVSMGVAVGQPGTHVIATLLYVTFFVKGCGQALGSQ